MSTELLLLTLLYESSVILCFERIYEVMMTLTMALLGYRASKEQLQLLINT